MSLAEIPHTCVTNIYPCPACDEGRRPEAVARRCHELARELIGPLRAIAKQLGYAIAIHGSLARDIDLVAVAWTDRAIAPDALVRALHAECQRCIGFAVIPERVKHHVTGELVDNPERKPHGRLGWTIHFHGGAYIDLSVVGPRSAEPA